MAAWRRVLVVGLAVLVGALPVFARVDAGLQVAATAVPQAEVPLPQGDEVGDDELLQAEGELGLLLSLLISALIGAAAGATYGTIEAQWFDEEPGIDVDDRHDDIAGGAAIGALGGLVARIPVPK